MDELSCAKCGVEVYESHEFIELRSGTYVICTPCLGAGKLTPEEYEEYQRKYK